MMRASTQIIPRTATFSCLKRHQTNKSLIYMPAVNTDLCVIQVS